MRATLPALLLALTAACVGTDPFDGDEITHFDGAFAGDQAPETSNDGDSGGFATPRESNVSATCDVDALEDGPDTLTLSPVAGGLFVEHAHLDSWCAVEWSAVITIGDGVIDVAYYDVDDTQDDTCACAWTLTYPIDGLTPGEWTVRTFAGEATATVTE